MGIFYSHIVFQPPEPPTYADEGGSFFFRRSRESGALRADGDEYLECPLVYLRTSRGNTIPGAFFYQRNSYYTILFSHGNGEDLGVSATYAHELSRALQTSVFAYDYSGYGVADGKAGEANCYADIRAAYTYLIGERRIPPHRILLFGRSLGSGPTVDLAAAVGGAVGGVVLIAGLTSCVRVVFGGLGTTLKFDMFANIDKVDRVAVPVFCVHGMLDAVVPFEHGLALCRRARYPLLPLWVRDAGHNNLESARFQDQVFPRYAQVLEEFRRWRRPADKPDDDGRPPADARDAPAGRLGRVAGCFLPARRESAAAADKRPPRNPAAMPRSRSLRPALARIASAGPQSPRWSEESALGRERARPASVRH